MALKNDSQKLSVIIQTQTEPAKFLWKSYYFSVLSNQVVNSLQQPISFPKNITTLWVFLDGSESVKLLWKDKPQNYNKKGPVDLSYIIRYLFTSQGLNSKQLSTSLVKTQMV